MGCSRWREPGEIGQFSQNCHVRISKSQNRRELLREGEAGTGSIRYRKREVHPPPHPPCIKLPVRRCANRGMWSFLKCYVNCEFKKSVSCRFQGRVLIEKKKNILFHTCVHCTDFSAVWAQCRRIRASNVCDNTVRGYG